MFEDVYKNYKNYKNFTLVGTTVSVIAGVSRRIEELEQINSASKVSRDKLNGVTICCHYCQRGNTAIIQYADLMLAMVNQL